MSHCTAFLSGGSLKRENTAFGLEPASLRVCVRKFDLAICTGFKNRLQIYHVRRNVTVMLVFSEFFAIRRFSIFIAIICRPIASSIAIQAQDKLSYYRVRPRLPLPYIMRVSTILCTVEYGCIIRRKNIVTHVRGVYARTNSWALSWTPSCSRIFFQENKKNRGHDFRSAQKNAREKLRVQVLAEPEKKLVSQK